MLGPSQTMPRGRRSVGVGRYGDVSSQRRLRVVSRQNRTKQNDFKKFRISTALYERLTTTSPPVVRFLEEGRNEKKCDDS